MDIGSILAIIGLAGGALSTSSTFYSMGRLTKVEQRLDIVEDHIQVTESGTVAIGIIGVIVSALLFKQNADNAEAINALAAGKADKQTVDTLVQRVNHIDQIKADKSTVDAINANVKLLSGMMNGKTM